MRISALSFALLLAFGSMAWAAEIYVSPGGDDTNAGTKVAPLRTFAAARQAVRTLRRETDRPITVLFDGGTYYLPKTIVLTADDSGTNAAPITYAAAPGQQVTISGGQRIKLDWRPYKNGIMRAEVPEGFTSDQLFVDGKRRPMARYPSPSRIELVVAPADVLVAWRLLYEHVGVGLARDRSRCGLACLGFMEERYLPMTPHLPRSGTCSRLDCSSVSPPLLPSL